MTLFIFNDFDIEPGFQSFLRPCSFDWVSITDSDGNKILPRTCGSEIPGNVSTNGNKATLNFYSDNSGTRRGFKAEVYEVAADRGMKNILDNV